MLKKILCPLYLLWAQMLYGQAFQVVISEILPDPDPPLSLPSEEFIELTNVSGKRVDLSGWQLSNGRTEAVFPPGILLETDSILIVCPAKAVSAYATWGPALALQKFPALTNEGDTLALYNSQRVLVHAIAWSKASYPAGTGRNGRSLEMVDLRNACSFQGNWLPSISVAGGTPGHNNSFSSQAGTEKHFTLLYAYAGAADQVTLVFDDTIDSGNLSATGIQAEPALEISTVAVDGLLKNRLVCTLEKPLTPHQVYQISADGIRSCLLHPPGGTRRVKFGLPDERQEGVVLNELMADPPGDGSDYIEIYNAGDRILDLQKLWLANRNPQGYISSVKPLSAEPGCLCPGEFLVCTEDPAWLFRHYHVKDPLSIRMVNSLPSWPNASGSVLILDVKKTSLDELNYQSNWHFELLRNHEGVALERRDPRAKTQDRENWFSAAESSGFGTPGYQNSQFLLAPEGDNVWVEPAVFSPNGDGAEDFCLIQYRFNRPGILMTLTLFNRNGYPVKQVVNNALCGTSGHFRWDGRDDHHQMLPANLYYLVADIFSTDGKTKRFRMTVSMGY